MASRHARLARVVKLAVLSLAPVTVLVGTAELLAGVTIARRARVASDSVQKRSVYSLAIGYWPWSRRSVTPLNRLGYPTDEFPPPSAKGKCMHVVFAGDSFVFGDGVDRDSNFVELVADDLQRAMNPTCVRVFNLGVRGTTIDAQRDRVLALLDTLQPDLLILGQYQNDLTDLTNPGAILDPNRDRPRTPGADSIRVRMRAFDLRLVRFLAYQSFALLIRNGIERDVLRHWSIMADPSRAGEAERLQRAYTQLFTELTDSLRRRHVEFAVVILPSKFDVMARRYPEEAYFIGLARETGVPYLRLFPVLDSLRDPYAFLLYDGHLNEHGNRVVASAISHWLMSAESSPLRRATQRRANLGARSLPKTPGADGPPS